MATLISLKRRIKAAQNVSKTTRAMQMISASRLKKAQEAALSSRPYVEKLTELAQKVTEKTPDSVKHPYMKSVGVSGKTLLIAISPDKGLCGGLLTNLLREFFSYTKDHADSSLVVIGKKLENQVVKLPNETLASFHFGTTLPAFDTVYPMIKLIDEYYLSGKVDSVKVLYTDFNSFFSQTPKVKQLLPITLPEVEEKISESQDSMIYEPSLSEMVPPLLKHYAEMNLYQFLLESYLSEQAARMIAMQNATNNARDIIEALKLEYNKTRQAKITGELLDIIGGRGAAHA
ncbi:MAG: synthase gamma chain [Patescibacteria group bacterium]|jgi:F-type H+-transporting ATPase subunit gamma|nr:synthase gamma chain [Patescibacteria group bacterium]